MTYKDIGPNRLAHLELIQSVVSRLAGNSFLVKGWAITVSAAIFGFAINSHSWRLAASAAIPIVAFWTLDAYFLRVERLFRALYDEVRLKDKRVPPFSMGATGSEFVIRVRKGDTACDNHEAPSWLRAIFTLTLLVLYGGLLVAAGVIAATTDSNRSSSECPQRSEQAARMRSAIPSRSTSSSKRGPRGQIAPKPSRCHRGTR
jgi:hypothetical protein